MDSHQALDPGTTTVGRPSSHQLRGKCDYLQMLGGQMMDFDDGICVKWSCWRKKYQTTIWDLGCINPCKWWDKLPINLCKMSSINSTVCTVSLIVYTYSYIVNMIIYSCHFTILHSLCWSMLKYICFSSTSVFQDLYDTGRSFSILIGA